MSEKFVLRSTVTSPFGRKVRMTIDVLGLADRVTLEPANTRDEHDTLRLQNPLGKMPCLMLADGTALFDSRVIIEFLQDVAGATRLLPPSGLIRYKMLTRAALADGIMDAALLVVYETRFRDTGTYSDRFLTHQRGKITRALASFEAAPPASTATDIVSIGLACALGYLDQRRPVDWRPAYGGLAAWLDAFRRHEPAFDNTFAAFADQP
ncbi:MAG TPA: glutathione S-transferase N-terminal domain-containing protein [Pseudolabrys sp.]|nr:glutathione S-transferase N-terminal domain-containing protein [Pseudolabrys sp.]